MATTEGQSPKKLERKADAKEEIVNATSGAREIVDHAAFNARAVGKILLHPFDKEAKAGAIATAREDKAASGQKMAAIRQVGAQQASALRSAARGEDSPVSPGSSPHSEAGEADAPASIPVSTPASIPVSTPATDSHTASDKAVEPEADAPASNPKSTPATDAHTASDTVKESVSGDHDRV